MNALQTICGPWREQFFELVTDCSSRLLLVSPYVKEQVITEILCLCKPQVEICLVSRFSVSVFHSGASDVAAYRQLVTQGATAYTVPNLHAKVYVFDDKAAVITSANLTNNGLNYNWEYGLKIEDQQMVSDISQDVQLLLDEEPAPLIDPNTICEAEKIIASAPPLPEVVLPEVAVQLGISGGEVESEMVFSGGIEAIHSGLTGWKLSVFDCLNRIHGMEFTLGQVYEFIDELQEQYPNNQNVDAKIRQQLQFLAHLGLVQFLGSGKYRKL